MEVDNEVFACGEKYATEINIGICITGIVKKNYLADSSMISAA